jgi:hypothetical protein
MCHQYQDCQDIEVGHPQHGGTGRDGSGLLEVSIVTQSQRRRRATAGNQVAKVRAIASDPHVHALATAVALANQRDHQIGGRPTSYPDWCMVVFGASIRVFGSASATARAFTEHSVWNDVLLAAATIVGAESVTAVPPTGPNRDHWSSFCKRRLNDSVLEQLVTLQRDLAIDRAHEVGLLNHEAAYSPGNYRRDHVLGLDGKVFSSPLRTLDTERLNKVTGELRPVRHDHARQRYGEGGVDGIVWGTKFAIASVRSPLANHRVILGISHFDAKTPGGEGKAFTDLAVDLADRTHGIQAFTADGAWRGTHLNQIQTVTGRGVIAPARRKTGRNGGIVINGHGHAAQPLPWSRRRKNREAACGGHQLWAAAGTLFEQIITADGESEFRELIRHQTKRDITRHKKGSVRHQFYARYTLPCAGHPDHDWWEPLLATAEDAKTGFNRCEYLRVVPTTGDQHKRLYGMRQDTESLNAQLERAFYGQRLPAWGVHNQTVVVLMAAQAENSWARHVWHDEAQHQRRTRNRRLNTR